MKLEEGKRKLPDGWRWVKLGEVSTVVRGSSPRPKGDPRYYGGNVPRLMVADVTRDGMYVTPKIDFLTAEGAQFSRPMKKGDVVMVVSGAPGLPAILAVDTCIHDGFVGFKNLDKNILINSFLFYFLKEIKATTDSQATGAIFRNLTTDQIKDISIAAPPLNEQRRIVEILDEKMEVVERSRQATLAQLETAKALPSAYLRAVFNSPEAQKWQRKKLGEVCEIQLGKMLSPASKAGIRYRPYLRNANVQWNRFDLTDVYQMDFSEREEEKFELKPGDLLVCEGGEPGRAAVWNGEIIPCFYQKTLHRLRPVDGIVNTYFLMYWFWHNCLQGKFIELHTKTTIAHLTAITLNKTLIEVPLLNEQQRIVGILKEQITEVEKLRKYLEEQLDAINQLPATFLRQAFNGEL